MSVQNETIIMHGCPICLDVISVEAVSCTCGHIGHHNTKDAWAVTHYVDDVFSPDETYSPFLKVGDKLSYWVGSLRLTGVLEEISFRNQPFTGALYIYHIKILESNNPKHKVGSIFSDDEIYFGKENQ